MVYVLPYQSLRLMPLSTFTLLIAAIVANSAAQSLDDRPASYAETGSRVLDVHPHGHASLQRGRMIRSEAPPVRKSYDLLADDREASHSEEEPHRYSDNAEFAPEPESFEDVEPDVDQRSFLDEGSNGVEQIDGLLPTDRSNEPEHTEGRRLQHKRTHHDNRRKEFFSRGSDYPAADMPPQGYARDFERQHEYDRQHATRYPQFRGSPQSMEYYPQDYTNGRFSHDPRAEYEKARARFENAKAQFDEASTQYAQFENTGSAASPVFQSSPMPAMMPNQMTMLNQAMPAMMPNQVDNFGRYLPEAPGNQQEMMFNGQMFPDARGRQPYYGGMMPPQQGRPLYGQGQFAPMQAAQPGLMSDRASGELPRSDPTTPQLGPMRASSIQNFAAAAQAPQAQDVPSQAGVINMLPLQVEQKQGAELRKSPAVSQSSPPQEASAMETSAILAAAMTSAAASTARIGGTSGEAPANPNDAAAMATSAAMTAARVAASLPASLPSDVRKATLEATAKAALESSLLASKAASGGDEKLPQTSTQADELPSGGANVATQTPEQLEAHKSMVAQNVANLKDLKEEIVTSPREDRELYVGIFSKSNDFEGRNTLRRNWVERVQKLYATPGKIRVEFIIGRMPLKSAASTPPPEGQSVMERAKTENAEAMEVQLDLSLSEEFKKHKDLYHVPYEELPVKVLMFFAHAVEMRYRFVMKIDINQDLLFRPLLQQLRAETSDSMLYGGQHMKDLSLLEVKASKDKKSKVERYFAGPCYLASWSLAQRIAKKHLDHSIMLWSYNTEGSDVDDMDMGQWVAYEDKLLKQLTKEKRANLEKTLEQSIRGARVDYRLMDVCRPLPASARAHNTTEGDGPESALIESPTVDTTTPASLWGAPASV